MLKQLLGILIFFAGLVLAGQNTAPLTLTPSEQAEAAQAQGMVRQAEAVFNRVAASALAADTSTCDRAMAAIYELKLAHKDLQAAQQRLAMTLAKQQAAHSCADCSWDAAGKALVKGQP